MIEKLSGRYELCLREHDACIADAESGYRLGVPPVSLLKVGNLRIYDSEKDVKPP